MPSAADRQRARRDLQRALGRMPIQLWVDQETLLLMDQLKSYFGDDRAAVVEAALRNYAKPPKPLSRHSQPHQRRRQALSGAGFASPTGSATQTN